ncbi:3-hydroxyacyl-CoA dehydrogenase family protein [Aneurinibacillus sp. UBA3580]|jgi:3-hydroxyacyl-CoA dehydrogenase|uniref:3-hydroxyacyl-CoA dehydrogenase family protein n=1 Tax=Aneurinibacillus sp. UBA3580 TaxID=1946041 RepID=UPI00257C73A0|nr:3-hydroxyacyl-CoA dehydrogenase family protein [Aneurinibacillus sp. UBA3580]
MIQQAAVIGSGVMGHGIAQVYAQAGIAVILYDLEDSYLEKAKKAIEANLALQAGQGLLTETESREALARITTTTNLEETVRTAEFITEAIPEVIEWKWELYEKLERLAKPDAVIASNTSTLPISRLAEKMSTPERMVITHFFNPAQLVPLVEVVRHDRTTEEAIQLTMELMRKIGKAPVLLKKEVPGFIANRLQAALAREAFHLLEEGVAEARDIDLAVTAGPGFRWSFIGPIETADFGGLDTWKRVIDNLAPVLSKSQQAPDLLNECVEAGNLGTKTGQGIYKYENASVSEKIKERDEKFIELLKIKQR